MRRNGKSGSSNAQRIDVIVPAYRAHETLGHTLGSLAMQSIAGDLDVTVIDDACPEGDYHDLVVPFSSRLNLKLVRLPRNLGPGGARQAGIDATDDPYFTCLDSDDELSGPSSLELLRDVMEENKSIQRCGGGIMLYGSSGELIRQSSGGVSMDGKLFRRSFIERYGIRFNGTRANEDYGYNLAVDMLCDNDAEQTCRLSEAVVNVYRNPKSITAAGEGQFRWDQRICGFIDNTIWAVDLAEKYRPDSDAVSVEILRVLLITYCYWCIIAECAPEYAAQAWEYAKKYYHLCYRHHYCPAYESMEKNLTPETTPLIFETFSKRGYFSLPEGCEPAVSFDEFLKRMRTEEYDPDHIYDVWAEMARSPEMRSRMKMNEETGVCERGYAQRKENADV